MSLTSRNPSSKAIEICNVHYLFPCMSKSALEQVDKLLKTQLRKNKRARDWRLIMSSLKYWTHYARVVRVWIESKSTQVVRNGRQLFEFVLGLQPSVNAVELMRSISGREKFLEEVLILYCESIFTVLQVHGGQRVYQVSKGDANLEIDWDMEDEAQIADMIERQMSRSEITPDSQADLTAFGLSKSASVSYRSSMKSVIDYRLVDILMARLNEKQFAYSPESLSLAIASLLEKMVLFFEGRPLWIFFHVDYLRVLFEFSDIENVLLRKQESFKKINSVITQIFDSYCQIWKNNALLPMESLFRFDSVDRVERVLKNYPRMRGDGQHDLDVHTSPETNLGDLRDKLEDELGDVSVFVRSGLWTEKEDLVLAQNYASFVLQDKVFTRLRDLLRDTLASDKTLAQVRKRVEYLNLARFSESDSRIKIKTLHSAKLNFTRVLRGVLQALKPEQRAPHWSAFVAFMKRVISEFAEFKMECPESLEEFAVVPQTEAEFKAVFVFQSVLQSMDVINPRGKRAFWRMPNYVSPEQVSERLEDFDQIFEGLGSDLKLKSKKKMRRPDKDIDDEFADLVRDEFNFDVGGESGAQSQQKKGPIVHENRGGRNAARKSGKTRSKTKRRLKRLSKRTRDKAKATPAKSEVSKVAEEREIEGLVSQVNSDASSVVSHGSSVKENVPDENARPMV